MKNNKGISLIEILIVLAILGIFSAISYPHFNKKRYIIKSDAMNLWTICSRAKSEAVKRNRILYVGIDGKDVDFYTDNQLVNSYYLNYFNIHTDSVTGGELGGKEVPKIIPDEVIQQCGGILPGCQSIEDWYKSFEGKYYEYIFSFNQMGITNAEILLKLEVDNELLDTLNINFIGTIKTVLYTNEI